MIIYLKQHAVSFYIYTTNNDNDESRLSKYIVSLFFPVFFSDLPGLDHEKRNLSSNKPISQFTVA